MVFDLVGGDTADVQVFFEGHGLQGCEGEVHEP